MDSIHVAVTRQVKPGCEEEFEHALREFARESLREPGTTGVHLIEPVPGTNGCEYGMLRSFDSEDASRRFYQSEIFLQWQKRAEPLVVGDSAVRRLHGLEAFFRESKHAPPRWKMALVTWLGVFPTVLLWSSALPPLLVVMPKLIVAAIVNIFVVVTLTWAVMPLLTKLLAGWLQASSKK
ncbi:Antibiotic biosynthesis monooxygenase [Bremerella volcania]|uniref:Antibiotic biosynthesis monooxygenase n=1 Tax=Bremerella volcania TaxID=2527984 RepID=A0A518C9I9_9BACT|nr:antibiotic biosynthesis monooxygenase [Bremerella volcania]QDU75896.1 Antibiotic biosynthesis monooxygenase [Bremerella volcania]